MCLSDYWFTSKELLEFWLVCRLVEVRKQVCRVEKVQEGRLAPPGRWPQLWIPAQGQQCRRWSGSFHQAELSQTVPVHYPATHEDFELFRQVPIILCRKMPIVLYRQMHIASAYSTFMIIYKSYIWVLTLCFLEVCLGIVISHSILIWIWFRSIWSRVGLLSKTNWHNTQNNNLGERIKLFG